MADAGRCLSDLSDDLLRHILFLAPDREGAATAVLSRRWRWLWRTSGVVHVDSRSFCPTRREQKRWGWAFPGGDHDKEALATHEAFFRGAEKAIAAAAAHGPIRRLTFFIAEDNEIILLTRWLSEGNLMEYNLMEALVSNPAARRVVELQILVRALNTRFTLSFGSLPSEALRELRIIGCNALTAAPPPGAAAGATFPMLVDLHLQDCSVSLVDLQNIIDASPRLSALHLASSYLFTKPNEHVGRILIPAVSVLVLTCCTYKASLELDVPRLQHFRYRGSVEDITNHLSIKSSSQVSANMVHVDLDLTHPIPNLESFWRFIQNFSTTKLLKLRMDHFTINDLALSDKARRDELLAGGLSFSLVEQLELEAQYIPGVTSMTMLANLLQCFPMVRDIRIKLTKRHESNWSESSVDKEAGVHFNKSVSGFRNRRRRMVVSLLVGQNDDNNQALDIPGLTGEDAFSCLQSHLKRVSLHFFREQPNCLGVQLAKFFAENAMVLQEMHIDDGCQEMLEHANFSVRRWIANNTDIANNQLTVKD